MGTAKKWRTGQSTPRLCAKSFRHSSGNTSELSRLSLLIGHTGLGSSLALKDPVDAGRAPNDEHVGGAGYCRCKRGADIAASISDRHSTTSTDRLFVSSSYLPCVMSLNADLVASIEALLAVAKSYNVKQPDRVARANMLEMAEDLHYKLEAPEEAMFRQLTNVRLLGHCYVRILLKFVSSIRKPLLSAHCARWAY